MRSRISCSWCRSRQQCSRSSWSWPQPGPPCQPHCQFGQPCTVTTFAAGIGVGANGAACADAAKARPRANARIIARIFVSDGNRASNVRAWWLTNPKALQDQYKTPRRDDGAPIFRRPFHCRRRAFRGERSAYQPVLLKITGLSAES
jgi:hypothetical protein